MRHSTTFLMSLIVASILVLMFLNLVLGSVSIPLKSVWNIICGTFRAGDQLRCEHGCGLCGTAER